MSAIMGSFLTNHENKTTIVEKNRLWLTFTISKEHMQAYRLCDAH
jgi:hypothetical protein